MQAWFGLTLGLLGVMILATAAVGAALFSRTTEAGDRLVDRIAPARMEALHLESALLDQETAVRGYLLTGNPALLEPYERGLEAERRSTARLAELLRDDPAARATTDAVEKAANTWRADFAVPSIDSTRSPSLAPAVQLGQERFEEVRRQAEAQQTRLTRTHAEARATFGLARSDRDRILLAFTAAFLLTGACLAVLLHVSVVRPLAQVRAASQRVADGAFEEEIPQSGPSDLRSLARAVEAMRRRTVDELAASRHNTDELNRTAADLDAQTVELRRSNAELEQFAYVASHDLQEPLRKVASFCQLLEKRYGDQLDERGTQYITFAVDGAKRMQVLINDLLTFSRVGRVQDAREPVALDDTVRRALRNLGAAIEESGAEVVLPDRMPEVMGDPTLLTMLWQNLIGNAVKFRHPDRTPRVEIAVRSEGEADAGFHTFTVTDNGIGIPAEFADKVFVIFQRLHGRETYGGTGIGLSLCKKIVEHAGGRIWIDGAHTGGARLAFTLPVIGGEETASAKPAPASESGPAPASEWVASARAPASVSASASVTSEPAPASESASSEGTNK
ncbi:sensor histidine kinase [Streptomyces sp. NPDC002990]